MSLGHEMSRRKFRQDRMFCPDLSFRVSLLSPVLGTNESCITLWDVWFLECRWCDDVLVVFDLPFRVPL
jgi:hypothetical protein